VGNLEFVILAWWLLCFYFLISYYDDTRSTRMSIGTAIILFLIGGIALPLTVAFGIFLKLTKDK